MYQYLRLSHRYLLVSLHGYHKQEFKLMYYHNLPITMNFRMMHRTLFSTLEEQIKNYSQFCILYVRINKAWEFERKSKSFVFSSNYFILFGENPVSVFDSSNKFTFLYTFAVFQALFLTNLHLDIICYSIVLFVIVSFINNCKLVHVKDWRNWFTGKRLSVFDSQWMRIYPVKSGQYSR